MKKTLFIVLCLMIAHSTFAEVKSIEEKTKGFEKSTGFFTYYWDDAAGKVWLEVKNFDTEFLYYSSLPGGLGSNDIGLDRNKLGGTKVVTFKRIGPKVLMIQPNYGFRALTDNVLERKAVEDAFAKSTIWGFKVEAETKGTVLIDLTDFLINDANRIVSTLSRSRQGNFKVDKSRSSVYPDNFKNFPKNSEFESLITLTGNNSGNFVRSVAPDAGTFTLRQHHSFVELTDGFEKRLYDPRSSIGGRGFYDYSSPVDQHVEKRFSSRHRLEKKDPNAAISEAVEPIIYYIDSGTPEPILSALIEGGSWWNQAYEAAGYKDAFQVKVLPVDKDPLDIRNNVVNWVHRSTRGWSYGSSVSDPRTGEILKGHVSLGSLRVRQDYMIAVGLLNPYEQDGSESDEMKKMALARIRQLSAHEIGHTIGLAHNYVSSTAGRASVMDYPHPLIKLNSNGTFDLSDAYDTKIGEWDKISIQFGYTDFADGVDEKNALEQILQDGMKRGFYHLADQDARPAGSAHPQTHLWDNGVNATEELNRVMEIRKVALDNFSEKSVRMGTPLATLEDVLVPIYFFHRYQAEAASKVLGGVYYYYNLRGDGQSYPKVVPADEQRNALNALLNTLDASNLGLSQKIINMIPPRPPGFGSAPELFNGRTGSILDPIAIAETSAQITLQFMLNSQRAARLVNNHALDNDYPSLEEVLESLVLKTWATQKDDGYLGEVARAVDNVVLNNMLRLATDKNAAPQVRGMAMLKIDELKDYVTSRLENSDDDNDKAHFHYALSQINLFEKNPEKLQFSNPLAAPPGSPIGDIMNYGMSCGW